MWCCLAGVIAVGGGTEVQLCGAINKMKPTSGSVQVGDPVEDDAVQEEGGGVDLHGAAQKTVEDPHVADVEAQEVTIKALNYVFSK